MVKRTTANPDGIRQKKSLGQVFLNTDWPVKRLVSTIESWGVKRVLEIGPGPGILTKTLLQAGFEVTAVEKDTRFSEKLADFYETHQSSFKTNLEIVNIDVLKFDLEHWLSQSPLPTAIVGNIPYNISTGILTWVLPHLQDIKGAEFLVQLEFASRVAGQAGTKDYGSLSVFSQLRAKVSIDCKVERACFRPIPKVDSALLLLQSRTNHYDDQLLAKVEQVARTSFTQRRKMLRNAIKQFLDEEKLAQCPFRFKQKA